MTAAPLPQRALYLANLEQRMQSLVVRKTLLAIDEPWQLEVISRETLT